MSTLSSLLLLGQPWLGQSSAISPPMTEPRPYRAGLGLPDAITIRGDPGPSTRQRRLFESAQLELAEQDWTPRESQTWTEWNINPARHGPERSIRLPTFVKSSSNYDELGRSALEGAVVEVDEGRRRKGKERAADGEDTSSWYQALASRSRAVSEPVAHTDGPAHVIVDLTDDMDDDDNDEDEQVVPDPDPGEDTKPASSTLEQAVIAPPDGDTRRPATVREPLRVHRSEWFIRRALLAQSRATDISSTSSSPGPSSITSMLNIGTSQPRVMPAQYVLGPDNKGYELLKSRHGWEGGGLGRPADWEERIKEKPKPNTIPALCETPPPVAVELDANGEPIVDLTIDSDSEADPEMDLGDEEPPRPTGPGRTAPVATSLKLDRLGLGHRRNVRAARDAEKKVTHTIEEIRRIQQRSRHPPPRHGIELGKKGKIKWKERDKREREDRQRLQAMLNN